MELMDRIFYGCMEELKENGVKFTMDSLAKRLGISKRTLYETVPSKNDVIRLVIDRTFQDVKEQQRKILEDTTLSTVDKLKKLFVVVPSYVNVLDYRRMNELKTAYPALFTIIQDKIESDWEPTLAILEKAMDEGILRRTNLVIVKLLLCEVYERLINGDVLIDNNISYEEAMKEMIQIILRGLLSGGNLDDSEER